MNNMDVRALSSSLSEEKSKELFAVGDSRKGEGSGHVLQVPEIRGLR